MGGRIPAVNPQFSDDNWSMARPSWSVEETSPLRNLRERRLPGWARGCLTLALAAVMLLAIFLLLPTRINVLILGVDSRPEEGMVARTDTMVMMTVVALKPYVGMLSIPRDLWVPIPGYGENRINAAHFFAEADQEGAGPQGAIDTIEQNFGVRMKYYVRLRFEGLQDVVEALGGVDVDLPRAMAGYPAGVQHMNGEQALAFVRDRAGSDDFFRIERGQLFLRAGFRQMLRPAMWVRLPRVILVLPGVVSTNLPLWQMPRLALALLRVGPDGIDNRIISRELVFPFTTSGGANVLAPNWDAIRPVVEEMFE